MRCANSRGDQFLFDDFPTAGSWRKHLDVGCDDFRPAEGYCTKMLPPWVIADSNRPASATLMFSSSMLLRVITSPCISATNSCNSVPATAVPGRNFALSHCDFNEPISEAKTVASPSTQPSPSSPEGSACPT